MTPELTAGIFGIIGVITGGIISWWLQKDRASTDLRIALESVKTEHMAEKIAQFFLIIKDTQIDLLNCSVSAWADLRMMN